MSLLNQMDSNSESRKQGFSFVFRLVSREKSNVVSTNSYNYRRP